MPFPDAAFEVVVSSWAIHNIYNRAEREQSIKEIVRVLKPGGKLAIVDIRFVDEYRQAMQSADMKEIQRRGPNLVFLIPSYLLTATR